MVQTYEIDDVCPVCGQRMTVTRLSCATCGSSLEGAFTVHESAGAPSGATFAGRRGEREDEARFGRLARLDTAQIEFVEAFLRCRGVIKNVEDMLGISYPTVRARLGNVLEAMGFGGEVDLPAADRRRLRRDILADLAAGRISTEDAHKLLAGAQSSGDEEDE